eukprot:scaffold833_cov352-Pavlova_lutheri.AAC.28
MGPGWSTFGETGCNCPFRWTSRGSPLLVWKGKGVHLLPSRSLLPPRPPSRKGASAGVYLSHVVLVSTPVARETSPFVRVLPRRRAHVARIRTQKRASEVPKTVPEPPGNEARETRDEVDVEKAGSERRSTRHVQSTDASYTS